MSKKDNIIKATLDLIIEEGIYSTTLPKIFNRANVGSGTFYNYFSNKEDVVNQLFLEVYQHMYEAIITHGTDGLSVKERFDVLSINTLKFAYYFPKEARFADEFANSSYIKDENKKLVFELSEIFKNIVIEGQNQNLIKKMQPRLCSQVWYGILFNVIHGYNNGKYEFTEEDFSKVIDIAWDAIRL